MKKSHTLTGKIKDRLRIIGLSAFFISCFQINPLGAQQTSGYELKIKAKGYDKGTVYLANYFGDKQYYADTTELDKNGWAVFKGSKPLPGGIYMAVFPGLRYFEFIFTEPRFSMETDSTDFVNNMKVKGSKENELFFQYLAFINQKSRAMRPLQEEFKKLNEDPASKEQAEELRKKLIDLDNEVKNYRLDFIEKNKGTFVAKMFQAMQEPEYPEPPLLPDGKRDSLYAFRYFKNHYWDGFDFTDDRLVRTPIYHNKLKKYFNQLVVQVPDSINREADTIIARIGNAREMYKYTVHYITSTFEKSNIMGMDAVFVHMGLNYYIDGKAFWLDSANMKKFEERVRTLEPLIIGKTAHNLSLVDTSGKKWIKLHDVKADFTILAFWDPDCGHCKKEMPKLNDFYKAYRKSGVEVYAVSSHEDDKWRAFLKEQGFGFINVAVPQKVYTEQNYTNEIVLTGLTDVKSLNYHSHFDIYSTPVIYLLDKDKRILAKRIDVENLEKLIEFERNKKKDK